MFKLSPLVQLQKFHNWDFPWGAKILYHLKCCAVSYLCPYHLTCLFPLLDKLSLCLWHSSEPLLPSKMSLSLYWRPSPMLDTWLAFRYPCFFREILYNWNCKILAFSLFPKISDHQNLERRWPISEAWGGEVSSPFTYKMGVGGLQGVADKTGKVLPLNGKKKKIGLRFFFWHPYFSYLEDTLTYKLQQYINVNILGYILDLFEVYPGMQYCLLWLLEDLICCTLEFS